VVRARLYTERLMEDLAEKNELATEGLHVSFYLLSFDTKEAADEAYAQVLGSDFVTVWNTNRSQALDENAEAAGEATEILWRSQSDLASSLGPELADIAFTLPLNVPGTPIEQVVDTETTRYHLLQVSGREVRPFTQRAIDNAKFQLLTNFIDQQLAGNSTQTEFWRSRVPTSPVLDPKFLVQATQPPAALPTIPGN
ncbi:MAG: hypothetical protein ACE5EY_17800, partial [Anaerolineae bacterium]